MADKVKALKIENPSGGGAQTDPFPVETNPAQDYLAAKGVAFENSDTQLFDLNVSGEIQWKDSVQTTYKTLNSISGGSSGIPQLTSDPVAPTATQTWVLATQTTAVGSPIGLLLSLTHAANGYTYALRYRTLEGTTVGTPLT